MRYRGYRASCSALTKQGKPCSIEPNEGSEFCHVHDPELQCGFTKRDGERCKMPTGGGPCEHHVARNPKKRRRPRLSPEERQARRARQSAEIDELLK